jgi:hypothetical protein
VFSGSGQKDGGFISGSIKGLKSQVAHGGLQIVSRKRLFVGVYLKVDLRQDISTLNLFSKNCSMRVPVMVPHEEMLDSRKSSHDVQ